MGASWNFSLNKARRPLRVGINQYHGNIIHRPKDSVLPHHHAGEAQRSPSQPPPHRPHGFWLSCNLADVEGGSTPTAKQRAVAQAARQFFGSVEVKIEFLEPAPGLLPGSAVRHRLLIAPTLRGMASPCPLDHNCSKAKEPRDLIMTVVFNRAPGLPNTVGLSLYPAPTACRRDRTDGDVRRSSAIHRWFK
jgi:hypothetical protein